MASRRARGATSRQSEVTEATTTVSAPSVTVGFPSASLAPAPLTAPRWKLHAKPKHVAIVAMGSSASAFTQLVASQGGIHAVVDEVWTINATAALFQHHRAFVMQDIKHNIMREAREGKKIAQGILDWLPLHPGPVYTSTAYPEWPALVEFPLRDALQAIGGLDYLNTSVAHAIAFAMHLGVEELSLYGCDFTYPDIHASESGRGCVEYLLGLWCGRGLRVNLPTSTTLMDAHVESTRRLYGYHDPVRVELVEGKVVVTRNAVSAQAAAPPSPPSS